MIIPREYKRVGYADTRPCGKRVYFLSEYLVHRAGKGHELLRVITEPAERGLMRRVKETELLATAQETCWHPGKVNLANRTGLIRLAMESGHRCTIFTGLDEHITFVLDPSLEEYLSIHVYDVIPPSPSLSDRVRDLEAAGVFGELEIRFEHHLVDISTTGAEVYPCRAAGFSRTLDADPMEGGEVLAACRVGTGVYRECYGEDFRLVNICPLDMEKEEPFLTRCCQQERCGTGVRAGKYGTAVHWGASPRDILRAVEEVVAGWRSGH